MISKRVTHQQHWFRYRVSALTANYNMFTLHNRKYHFHVEVSISSRAACLKTAANIFHYHRRKLTDRPVCRSSVIVSSVADCGTQLAASGHWHHWPSSLPCCTAKRPRFYGQLDLLYHGY